MNSAAPVKCALWARVSTEEQSADNQLPILRAWAERLGWEVTREYVTEDSAWSRGNGKKGQEFERKRQLMLADLRQGHFTGILIWHIDRLSRRGPEDMHRYLRLLGESGADVRADQCPWLDTTDPFARDVLIGVFSSLAGSQSDLKSKNIKNGMARVKREIEAIRAAGEKPEKKIGGRKLGSRDKRRREVEGYDAAWGEGGKRRKAAEERERTYTCQNRECRSVFTSISPVPAKYCSANCQNAVRAARRGTEGARLALRMFADAPPPMSPEWWPAPPEWERLAQARAADGEASWSEVADILGMDRGDAITMYRRMMIRVRKMEQETREAAERAAAVNDALTVLSGAGIEGVDQLLAQRAGQAEGSGEDN